MIFRVYRDFEKQWRWVATSSNGSIVAAAGHGYSSKDGCLKMAAKFAGVYKNARIVVDPA